MIGNEPTLVGVAELADRAGVKPETVTKWRQRHPDFPTPVASLAVGDVWVWADVAPWVAARPGPGRPANP